MLIESIMYSRWLGLQHQFCEFLTKLGLHVIINHKTDLI
jgi:hypothetical protein